LKHIAAIGIAVLALSSQANAEEMDFYAGLEYIGSNSENEFTLNNPTLNSSIVDTYEVDASSIRLKAGAILNNYGTRLQVDYEWTLDSDVDALNNTFETYDKTQYGLSLIQNFKVTDSFYPFLKVGGGVGELTQEGNFESQDYDYTYLSAGLGVTYRAHEHIELMVGYDYQVNDTDEQTDSNGLVHEQDEDENKFYFGVNFLF